MERQIYSSLYERLLLSNNKESVLAVAKNEKLPSDAKEIIKDPLFLEFSPFQKSRANLLKWHQKLQGNIEKLMKGKNQNENNLLFR